MSAIHGLIRMMAGGAHNLSVIIHPHGRAACVLLILKDNLWDLLDLLVSSLMDGFLGKGCSFLTILHALEVKKFGHQRPTRFKRVSLLRFLGQGDLWLWWLLRAQAHHHETCLILRWLHNLWGGKTDHGTHLLGQGDNSSLLSGGYLGHTTKALRLYFGDLVLPMLWNKNVWVYASATLRHFSLGLKLNLWLLIWPNSYLVSPPMILARSHSQGQVPLILLRWVLLLMIMRMIRGGRRLCS